MEDKRYHNSRAFIEDSDAEEMYNSGLENICDKSVKQKFPIVPRRRYEISAEDRPFFTVQDTLLAVTVATVLAYKLVEETFMYVVNRLYKSGAYIAGNEPKPFFTPEDTVWFKDI